MASYGRDNYAKLAKVKAECDPTNVFHLNRNIKPAWHAVSGNQQGNNPPSELSACRKRKMTGARFSLSFSTDAKGGVEVFL